MTPVLYILMRTDLPSMNAGKAMAQASHASNAFVHMSQNDPHVARGEMTEKWKSETSQGFGTVLVLAVNNEEMMAAVTEARRRVLGAAYVTDPTYPYRVDGEIAHLIPTSLDTVPRPALIDGKTQVTLYREEKTCAFIFADKDDPATTEILGHLKLHP